MKQELKTDPRLEGRYCAGQITSRLLQVENRSIDLFQVQWSVRSDA